MDQSTSVQKVLVQTSPAGHLSSFDWKSLAFTALTVAAGAAVTFLLEVLPGIEISDTTASMVMSVVVMGLKFLQKLLSEKKYVVSK